MLWLSESVLLRRFYHCLVNIVGGSVWFTVKTKLSKSSQFFSCLYIFVRTHQFNNFVSCPVHSCIHTHTHTYIHTHTTNTHIHTHTRTYKNTHTSTHTRTRARAHTHNIHTQTHTRAQTHTHTYIYIHDVLKLVSMNMHLQGFGGET